jgi:hypothetical protein
MIVETRPCHKLAPSVRPSVGVLGVIGMTGDLLLYERVQDSFKQREWGGHENNLSRFGRHLHSVRVRGLQDTVV